MNMKNVIKQVLLRGDGKINSAIIRRERFKKSKLNKWIYNKTNFLKTKSSYSERIYCILNNITSIPKCKICDNYLKFSLCKSPHGYGECCSQRCYHKYKNWTKNTDFKSIYRKTKNEFFLTLKNKDIIDREKAIEFIGERIVKTKGGLEHKFINMSHYKNNINELHDIILLTNNEIKFNENNIKWSERFYLLYENVSNVCPKCLNNMKYRNFVKGYLCKHCNVKEGKYKKNKDIILNMLSKKFVILKEAKSLNDDKFLLECKSCNHISKYWLRNGKWAKGILCEKCELSSISRDELQIRDIITKLYDGEIIFNYRFKEHRYGGREIDIYFPKLRIGIEYNGLYWHGETNKRIDPKYHLNKTNLCEENDIRLIQIFEDEWLYKKDIVISRLKYILNKTNTKIYARKCKIELINDKTKNIFLENNHIQGKDVSKIRLGLTYNNELISVMTFGKTRMSKKYQWELIRYATKLDTYVIGGASKLLKYFTRNYNPNSIVSYADKRWSNGNLYKQLGFNLSHISSPNYWYIINGVRESRIKYQKHKLEKLLENFDSNKTEYENMLDNGYDRVWDCGNMVFVWEN